MGILINSNDFDYGKYTINSSDVTKQDLTEYIKENEKMFIYELLGIELGDLFIADINEYYQPTSQRFLDIFNPVSFYKFGEIIHSKGMKEVLKGLVYSSFTREQNYKNNINGNSQNVIQSGTLVSPLKNGYVQKYNSAIESFCAIQEYIKENYQTYPEFQGVQKDYMSLI